jgi:large conductance mechanosensitive channel
MVPTDAVNKVEEVAIRYGNFINAVIQFLIVALCIFIIIKAINTLNRKEEEIPTPTPTPGPEETLLAEIRDLLKKQIK